MRVFNDYREPNQLVEPESDLITVIGHSIYHQVGRFVELINHHLDSPVVERGQAPVVTVKEA